MYVTFYESCERPHYTCRYCGFVIYETETKEIDMEGIMSPEVYNAVVEQAELEDEADLEEYKNIGLTD